MPETLQETLKDSLYLPQPARILDVKQTYLYGAAFGSLLVVLFNFLFR